MRASIALSDWNWSLFRANISFAIGIKLESVVMSIVFLTRDQAMYRSSSLSPFYPATLSLSWTRSSDVNRTLLTCRRCFFYFLISSVSTGPSGWGIVRLMKCSRSKFVRVNFMAPFHCG